MSCRVCYASNVFRGQGYNQGQDAYSVGFADQVFAFQGFKGHPLVEVIVLYPGITVLYLRICTLRFATGRTARGHWGSTCLRRPLPAVVVNAQYQVIKGNCYLGFPKEP